MSVTGEGLRVELLDSENGMFFQSGRPDPTDTGGELIASMAQQLGKLPNDLLIEGHTDSCPFGAHPGYSNWELSTDRAYAARRLMETSGLKPGQVKQVRGFADQSLRNKDNPDAASNRRISVIVRNQSLPDDPDPPPAAGGSTPLPARRRPRTDSAYSITFGTITRISASPAWSILDLPTTVFWPSARSKSVRIEATVLLPLCFPSGP